MGDRAGVSMKEDLLPECAERAFGEAETPMEGYVPAAASCSDIVQATCSWLHSGHFPVLKSSLSPVFINKLSLEHSHVLPLYTVCGCFPTTMSELCHCGCDRDLMAHKALSRKSWPTLTGACFSGHLLTLSLSGGKTE